MKKIAGILVVLVPGLAALAVGYSVGYDRGVAGMVPQVRVAADMAERADNVSRALREDRSALIRERREFEEAAGTYRLAATEANARAERHGRVIGALKRQLEELELEELRDLASVPQLPAE